MSDNPTPDPKPSVPVEAKSNEWRSPQVILPVLATISTVLVAVIGVIPSIMEANKPDDATPTPIVIAIIATPIPATPVPVTTVPTEVAVVSTDAPTTAPRATDVPAATVAPTSTPTDIPPTTVPTTVPTDVPPTAAPTDVPPTAAPTAVPNVTLFYDQDAFTIYNMTGGRISLEGIEFKGPEASWSISPFGSSARSLPGNKCLRLRDATVGNRTPPSECGSTNYAFLEIGPRVIFWRGQYFDVVRDGTVLATCQFETTKCEIFVPQE